MFLLQVSRNTLWNLSMKDDDCSVCTKLIRAGKEMNQSRPYQRLGVGTRAHARCILADRRAQTAAEDSEPRMLKRSRLDQGAATIAPITTVESTTPSLGSVSSTPSAPSHLNFNDVMRRHLELLGWTVVLATDRSRDLAHRVAQRRTRASGVPIIGNARQKDLTQLPGFDSIVSEWTALVKQSAAQVGVDVEPLFVVDHKILSAAPGQGAQVIHWDCAREKGAAEKYTCLLVCSLGHSSTALPTFAANDDLSFSNDPATMRSVAHLLAPEMYLSQKLFPGDIIFFRQSTPHFGVENTCTVGDRVMLFAVLSPSSEVGQDKEQVLPWLFVRDAFGADSREFAQVLVSYRVHDPIYRLRRDEGRSSAEDADDCLRRHSLFTLYYPSQQ